MKSLAKQPLEKRLKKLKSAVLDSHFHRLHEEAFETIDCLECANCCKTTSPVFYEHDIERAAHAVRMKPKDFMQRFLKKDEDNDYVLQSAPCPFLAADNYCSIYSARPTACREYPHTNRKKMYQLLDLTLMNATICPAVRQIVDRLDKVI